MKEFDFLPKWYKSGRQRQVSYRTQVIGLAGILGVMMVWNFAATHSISKATAALAEADSKVSAAESISREFSRIKSDVTQLQKKGKSIEEINSKIDVASVLAEISFLVDKKIVLSKVEFKAEKFADGRGRKIDGGSVVRAVGGNFAAKEALLLGDVRFKVLISGIAANAGDVAEFICRLEDSPYFRLVYPSFSRNKNIKPVRDSTGRISNRTRENYQVSEFEISCYLANYTESIIDN
jgi:hypothetical protein